jgi:hypothetical protein
VSIQAKPKTFPTFDLHTSIAMKSKAIAQNSFDQSSAEDGNRLTSLKALRDPLECSAAYPQFFAIAIWRGKMNGGTQAKRDGVAFHAISQ